MRYAAKQQINACTAARPAQSQLQVDALAHDGDDSTTGCTRIRLWNDAATAMIAADSGESEVVDGWIVGDGTSREREE